MPTSLDTYAPFDSGAGSNVTEATWRDFMRHMLGSASGVIRGFLNEFVVIGDNSGMNVKVDTGECWVRGHYGKSTAQKTLSIAAAHATLARKDRVILRADFTNNRVELDVLTGTAAASPITPSVTQSTTVWETSLAIVDIPAADTAIAASQVTDNRVYTSAHARYEQTSGQSIPNGTTTKATWSSTPVYASGDVTFQPASNDFRLERSGLWVIVCNYQFVGSGAGDRHLFIAKSGEDAINRQGMQSRGPLAGACVLNVVAQHRYSQGDVVAAFVVQTSGGALSSVSSERATNISLVWVGP